MRQFLILSLIIFSGCKASKPVSDVSITSLDYKVTERKFELSTDHRTAIDTTALSRLSKGETITRTDKKTGIKISTRITPQQQLVTVVNIPAITKEITLYDTTRTITKDRTIIQEKQRSFFERLEDHIMFIFWCLLGLFILLLALRIIIL